MDKKKIHWRSWERLCLTKHEGGLGFKNLHAYNLAMLAKQGWRLIKNPNTLIARLYKAKYHPHCSFLNAELGDLLLSLGEVLLQANQFYKVTFSGELETVLTLIFGHRSGYQNVLNT